MERRRHDDRQWPLSNGYMLPGRPARLTAGLARQRELMARDGDEMRCRVPARSYPQWRVDQYSTGIHLSGQLGLG